MWFLLKLFSLVVASLFMHNICKDKIDNYLLLSQQQSVYELPHISDACVLKDESGLLIGHVLNISESPVTSSLHHNSVYLPSNTSVDYLPFTNESYNYDNIFNDKFDDQCYVTDVLADRVAAKCNIQPIEESLPSTDYIDYLQYTNESYNNDIIFNDRCYVTDIIELRIDVESNTQRIKSNVYLSCNTSVDKQVFITESYTNGNVFNDQCYANDSFALCVVDEPGTLLTQAVNTGNILVKPDHNKTTIIEEEAYGYIFQQLKSYLPSYINKDLVNEYHVLSMEYQQRQQNDLLKPSWKQASNIYINKIKIFTRQTNSLLWKLAMTIYNTFQNHICGIEEAYDYIYQQLKSCLPLYICKELVNEYHVLSMEYQQRQQNDLSKPSWKQASNIYINKIKIFTRQTNSLLWKLLQHIVNCVKSITRSTINYLNHLNIIDNILSLINLFKMTVHSIDFQLRDLLYLNVFLLVIYETKKMNKKKLVHLTKYYEGEITSMELLLKNTNGAYNLEMNNMENTKLMEKLRSAELVKKQQNKYDKLLKKANNQLAPPFPNLPPPSPIFKHRLPPPPILFKHCLSRPTTYRINACQPFTNKPLSAVPKRLSTVRFNLASTALKSVKPIVQLPLFAPIAQRPLIATIIQRPLIAQQPPITTVEQNKIDSLQFFGCPDNYTRPTIRVN